MSDDPPDGPQQRPDLDVNTQTDLGHRWTRAARAWSQLITQPTASSPEEVVRHVLAVQAQDDRGSRLAIRSRSHHLTAGDVDAALTERRSMVVSWLQRGTLHLVAAEDLWWIHDLTAPRLVARNRRRLSEEGVGDAQAERGVTVVMDELAAGPRTKAHLRAALGEAGVPAVGQAFHHVMIAATLAGEAVRGPLVDSDHAYVSPHRWLGPRPPALERDDALLRLTARYLAAHSPAGPEDLARWSGLTLGDARRGFAAWREAGEMEDPAASPGDDAPIPPAKLLGAFDPILHGWVSREPIVGPHRHVVTTNGIFRPVVLVGGQVAGTWGLAGGRVTIRALEEISAADRGSLAVEALDVLRYLNLEPADPTFD